MKRTSVYSKRRGVPWEISQLPGFPPPNPTKPKVETICSSRRRSGDVLRIVVKFLRLTEDVQEASCNGLVSWEKSGSKLELACREWDGNREPCLWKLIPFGGVVPTDPNFGVAQGYISWKGRKWALASTCIA